MSTYHGEYTGNYFLIQTEMEHNAQIFANLMLQYDWSPWAICGILGNSQIESTQNPGIWQNLDEGNTSLGYSLLQWTPSTKYTDWCDENGYDDTFMESCVLRLEYELENNLQWIPTLEYPYTFAQFKNFDGIHTPTVMADMFLKCYERPADQNQPIRGVWAEYYFDLLEFDGIRTSTFETYRRFLPIQFTRRNRR